MQVVQSKLNLLANGEHSELVNLACRFQPKCCSHNCHVETKASGGNTLKAAGSQSAETRNLRNDASFKNSWEWPKGLDVDVHATSKQDHRFGSFVPD